MITMEYKGYIGSVETPESEDENNPPFFGSLQGIKDVVCYHADTLDELRFHFEDAIEDYLDIKERYGLNKE